MTLNLHFTLPAHGVVELVLGVMTLVSPVLFRFAGGGIVTAVVLGSILIGMAVTISHERRSSLAWHHLCDLMLVIATAVAALGLALAGEASASLLFAALAVLESGLNMTTRYVTS